ncbi:hypothetical protein D9758_018414 [Tetrapyrgos nigripes]|uniref:Uncharacterized protein n=1 Tax=Tetrapyrgos nigripes TaxID=182062 RepID=A0A8H5EQI2_9AGAR|nr:hypothetical protein D9758_018414 [Tetrapyrgos nigripes]
MAQRVRVVGDRKMEESSLLGLHKRREESIAISFPTPSSFTPTSSASNPSSSSLSNQPTNLALLNEVLWGTCNPPELDGSNDEGSKDECTNSLRDLVEEMVDSCQKEEWNEIAVSTRVGAGFPDSAKPSCGPCERELLRTYEGWLDSTGSGSGSSDASTSDPKKTTTATQPSTHPTPRSRQDSKRRMRMQLELWMEFVEEGSLITLRVREELSLHNIVAVLSNSGRSGNG